MRDLQNKLEEKHESFPWHKVLKDDPNGSRNWELSERLWRAEWAGIEREIGFPEDESFSDMRVSTPQTSFGYGGQW